MNLLLEIGNLNGLVALIVVIMIGPPLLLTIIGFGLYKNNKKAAKIFFILAVLYLLISLGICGVMVS